MRTPRNKTETFVNKRLSMFKSPLLVAIVLITCSILNHTSLVSATASASVVNTSTIVFDFDSGSPVPSLYQNSPFNYTSGGLTAHFGSLSDTVTPAFSIQEMIPLGYNLSTFSGRWLYDNQLTRDFLDIEFDAPIDGISLCFATIEPHGGPGTIPSYINLTAYMDSIGNQIGWTWARGETASEQNTQGTLSFNSSSQPFKLVRIYIPYQSAPVTVTDFFIDNVIVSIGALPDTTPPAIDVPSRSPSGEVNQNQQVTISVNVTDSGSGVKNVSLVYSLNNGSTWETSELMIYNATTDDYETTVPGQPSGVRVKYMITAYDNAGNWQIANNAGEYYTFIVIPESLTFYELLLFLTLTSLVFIGLKHEQDESGRFIVNMN